MKMICQDCKNKEATVNLTQIVNNEKLALSLCAECAAARGFHSPLDNVPFPLADILSGLAKSIQAPGTGEKMPDLVCRTCGLTFEEFARQGRFACGDCYSSFRPSLESIMRKIHGASLHRGRNLDSAKPKSGDDAPFPIKEEERVAEELRKAIEAEDFERAAELRDKLKELRESVATD